MDLVELLPHLRGHLHAELTPRGLWAERLTRRQQTHYQPNEMWALRGGCPAGIAIELLTDSPWLELELVSGRTARDWLSLDLLLDGVLQPGERRDGPPERATIRLALPADGGLHRVTVALPLTCETWIAGWALAPGARLEAAPRRSGRYLALGDSITQGMTGSGMASSYVWRLAQAQGLELLDQGIGGHVFDPPSFDPELPLEAEQVTVAYGTNDWSRGLPHAAIAASARAYLSAVRARYPRARIACISPIWRAIAEPERRADFTACGQAILEAAAGVPGVQPIDGLRLVPHRPDRFVDGVHPNDCGFAEYAQALHAALDQ